MPLLVEKKAGHGEDIAWTPPGLFPNLLTHAGYDAILPAITLRELTMLNFMDAVTDKPEWETKVLDETIVEKWGEEAIQVDVTNEDELTEEMFNYCIKELRYRAERHPSSPNGAIQVFPGAVYKSDTAIPLSTRQALQRAVKPLEDVPEHQKDWHPESHDMVLDLVHPSLFPLVYGSSKVLPVGARATTLEDCLQRTGEGEVVHDQRHNAPGPIKAHQWASVTSHVSAYSSAFQWLPCEVDVSGERPRISTYINNLHPHHHRELYTVIEDIIAETIPLWNLTLAPIRPLDLKTFFHFPRRIMYKNVEYNPDPEYDGDPHNPEPVQADGETDLAYDIRLESWYDWCEQTREVVLPDPPEEFVPLEEPKPFCIKTLLGSKPMQVIVKLANIELTPEKPAYEGGTWHVEGKMNETICASAIYYYSSENITNSQLTFSQQCKAPGWPDTNYRQNTTDWIVDVFGLEHEGPPIQTLGSVVTKEGRLVTFPNIMLHQVQPFELEDPKKPGHRKILALFLVDPHTSVISTADVPPQRRDWWADEVVATCGKDGSKNWFNRLPNELRHRIFQEVERFPLSREAAEKHRKDLMDERKGFVLDHQRFLAAATINLCEH